MQRTWEIGEIGRIAETLAATGPNADFAAGVMALAYALNAPVRRPSAWITPQRMEIVIEAQADLH